MKKYSSSREAGAGAAAGATTLDSRKTSTASVSASAGREPEEKNCERPGEQGGVALDAIASEKAKATEVETALLEQISVSGRAHTPVATGGGARSRIAKGLTVAALEIRKYRIPLFALYL